MQLMITAYEVISESASLSSVIYLFAYTFLVFNSSFFLSEVKSVAADTYWLPQTPIGQF
jgi:hypothetical protein